MRLIKTIFLLFLLTILPSVIFSQTDSRLNGSWVFIEDGMELEFVFRNGAYDSIIDGTPVERGVYTTSDNTLTLNSTHGHGDFYNGLFEFTRFESRWYSTNEIVHTLTPFFLDMGLSREQVEDFVKEVISESESQSFTYMIDVNTLILSHPADRSMLVLTKRPG